MMIRALATETRSLVYDFSPISMAAINCDRKTMSKYAWMVANCTRVYSPSIILVDNLDYGI